MSSSTLNGIEPFNSSDWEAKASHKKATKAATLLLTNRRDECMIQISTV
jgi:hypothetical protein